MLVRSFYSHNNFQLTCKVLTKFYVVFCLELPFSEKLGVLYTGYSSFSVFWLN